MLKEQHEELLSKITENLTDQGQVTKLLNELREDYEVQLNEIEALKNNNDDLISKNENLRASNMELFLKLGTKKEVNENDPIDQTKEDIKEENNIKTFDNLFDENGGLK